jgi:two-component sensor histidine kinase
VEISWKTQNGPAGEREFTLTWDETFPSISADSQREASRRGFGATVLERIVPLAVGGKSTLERDSDHVRWTLIAPFEEIAAQHRIGGDREDEPLNLALSNLGEAEIAP